MILYLMHVQVNVVLMMIMIHLYYYYVIILFLNNEMLHTSVVHHLYIYMIKRKTDRQLLTSILNVFPNIFLYICIYTYICISFIAYTMIYILNRVYVM